MDYINTIREGKKYRVPYSELESFLADGGKFASPQDKELAMRIEQSQKPGFLGRIGKDIVAGGAGLARNVGELGLAGVKSIEDLGKMVSQATQQARLPQMQQQEESPAYSEQGQQLLNKLIPQDYSKQYGPEQPNLMDRIIQGGLTHAPELIGGAALLKKGLPYISKKAAARPYKQAQQLLKKEGVSKINPSQTLIDDAKLYFKDNAANKALIEKAESGDIAALFKLQSDLGQKSAGYARNPFSFAERDFGREGFKIREAMLQHKQQELEKMGMKDAADLLEKGRQQFRGYHAFKPIRNFAIGYGAYKAGVPSYLKKLMLD